MNPTQLKRDIEGEGVLDEFEERNYLGMSAISTCPLELYRRMMNGREPLDVQGRRYCHEGYLHENDIVLRLNRAGWPVRNLNRELVAPFDALGRFVGHIDGDFSDTLMLEIKSVMQDRFDLVIQTGRCPVAHYEQVQMYLRYGGYESAMVIYKQRENGQVWALEVLRNDRVGDRLEAKARAVLEAVDRGEEPECVCGRCR